jgi:RES domain-containing protein
MPEAWRIVKSHRAATAFDGEGARLYGGRWNSPGVPVVYCAGSVSLAVLELLVHLQRTAALTAYSLIALRFDEADVERLDRQRLPASWRDSPPPAATQAIGDGWLRANATPVLEVPSTVVPGESNFLVDPRHPGFTGLEIGSPEPFVLDPRLR